MDNVDEKSKNVLDILNPIYVGKSLLTIYKDVTKPDIGISNLHWDFLSANQIKDGIENFGTKMIDIGIRYHGMGWYTAISYIPKTDNFCFRRDGGSNDYDRRDNYEKYKSDKYNPADFPALCILSGNEFAESTNMQAVKFKDFKIRKIQYTYDDLVNCGFFRNIQKIE